MSSEPGKGDGAPALPVTTSEGGTVGEERRILGNVSYVIGGSRDSRRVQYRNLAADILESPWFDNTIGLVIASNAVCIGMESTARLEGWQTSQDVLNILENCWLAIYTLELLLRFFAVRWRCLKDNWVKFDCVLVVSGITTQWLLEPAGFDVSALGPMMVLRMMRLLRLARTLKLIVTVKELWLLVRSLLDSAGTMFYTMGLLLIILYVFACIGVELITFSPAAAGEDADPEFQALVAEHFPSVLMTMMTLVQFVCFDSIAGIYKPFVMLDPTPPILSLYFAFAFVFMGIVLMNLITAVVVNAALEQAGKDKEAMRIHAERERRTLIKGLRKMFVRLDADGSGQVTLMEVQSMGQKDREDLMDAAGINNPAEIFEALDVDGNGLLNIDDFCDGMWKVSASQVPLEVKRTEKQVALMREMLRDVQQAQLNIQDSIVQLQRQLIIPSLAASGEPCKDQALIPRGGEAWAEELALRLQRSVQLGVRAALGTAPPDCAGEKDALIAREASAGLGGSPPAWASEMLLELKQLRSEVAVLPGLPASELKPLRSPPLSAFGARANRREDALRAVAADIGRGACAGLCRPIPGPVSAPQTQSEETEVPFIGRRLFDDPQQAAQLGDSH